MVDWIIQFMEQHGYLGVFMLMTLENLFPPIPSEVILPFGGFLTTYTNLSALGVVILATSGSVTGAILLYGAGYFLGIDKVADVVDKWGVFLRLRKEDVFKTLEWFNKYGVWTVLLCRMIPLVRSLISIPAGMSGMNFTLFVSFTLFGTFTWNVLLVTAGVILGESWSDILHYMHMYSALTYSFTGVIFLLLMIWIYLKRKKLQKR
ncbi:DedA family protein [Halobacillus sp. KCTC 3957]|uniref:DedA family protein n=2 Tax=Halobacillus yeomjeoni TaxID=311194 RepID=A0A931HTV1_9BACI|nr:DedA family protein [Halobacillus yeomjeoni]